MTSQEFEINLNQLLYAVSKKDIKLVEKIRLKINLNLIEIDGFIINLNYRVWNDRVDNLLISIADNLPTDELEIQTKDSFAKVLLY